MSNDDFFNDSDGLDIFNDRDGFYIIYPEKSIWTTVLSQTKILNIFTASVSLAKVRRSLECVCIRKTRKYIPQSALWISRLFIKLASRNGRVCLTLEYSGINKDGPGRFRIKADEPDCQTCYFNVVNDEQSYNEFVRQCINSSKTDDRIQFNIIHLKSKMNSEETFDATEEPHNLHKNNGARTTGDNKKRARTALERTTETQNLLNNPVQGLNHELELNQNFFLDDNVDGGLQQTSNKIYLLFVKCQQNKRLWKLVKW